MTKAGTCTVEKEVAYWMSCLKINFIFLTAAELWKSKTRDDLRVKNSNHRVTSSNLQVTSSNPQFTSSNLPVTRKIRFGRLKARVRRLKA